MMLLLRLTLTHLQVLVGRDPVPPHSQHTDDVMLVWEELHLFWFLVFLQTHCTWIRSTNQQTHRNVWISALRVVEDIQYCAQPWQKSAFTSWVYDYIHAQSSCLLQNHWQQVWRVVIDRNHSGFTHKDTDTWYHESFWFVIHLNAEKHQITSS